MSCPANWKCSRFYWWNSFKFAKNSGSSFSRLLEIIKTKILSTVLLETFSIKTLSFGSESTLRMKESLSSLIRSPVSDILMFQMFRAPRASRWWWASPPALWSSPGRRHWTPTTAPWGNTSSRSANSAVCSTDIFLIKWTEDWEDIRIV